MLGSKHHAKFLVALCVVCTLIFLSTSAHAAKSPGDKELYSVQFRVATDQKSVWKFVEMISGLGFPSYMYTEQLQKGEVRCYAQMGTYPTIVDAIDAAAMLKKKVKVDFDIVIAHTNKVVELDTQKSISDYATEDGTIPESTPKKVKPEQKTIIIPRDKGKQTAPPKTAKVAPKHTAPIAESDNKIATSTTHDSFDAKELEDYGQGKVYLVQAYSFKSLDNAKRSAKKYKKSGYPSFIIKLFDNNHSEWYVVNVGHFKTLKKAKQSSKTFLKQENKSATITRVDAELLRTRVIEFE